MMDEWTGDKHADDRDNRKRKERQGMQVDGRSTKSLANDRYEEMRLEINRYKSSVLLGAHVNEAHNGTIQAFCPECNSIIFNRKEQ